MKHWKKSSERTLHIECGQALTECAILVPLFIFMLLGTLQLGLIYQARYLLKYAAYRATRTGALQNACADPMKDAALAVLSPIMGTGIPRHGTDRRASDGYNKIDDATGFAQAILQAKSAMGPMGAPILDVIICGPTETHLADATKNDSEIDFDDPRNLLWDKGSLGKKTLRQFERTKLRVQVQYLHQLIVPFSNWILFYAWTGMNLMRELRMQSSYTGPDNVPGINPTGSHANDQGRGHRRKAEHLGALVAHAQTNHRYFLPLHANYAFRMHSNLFPDKEGCAFPEENACWHYADGDEGAI